MSIDRRARGLVLALSLSSACATTTAAGPGGALRPLEEVRAVRVIEDALGARGHAAEHGRPVHLAATRVVLADVSLAGTRHSIEFVTAADRERFGALLPPRRTPGALRMAPGVGADQGADVLILDEEEFLFEPDLNLAGPNRPSLQEVEDRLHRAVVDWLSWLRTQGRL